MIRIALFVIVFVMMPLVLFAIGTATGTFPDLPGTFTPADYVSSFMMYVGVVVLFLVPLINRFLKWEGNKKRYMSWGVLLVVGAVSYLAGWGIFDTSIINAVLIVVGGALGSHIGYKAVKLILTDYGALPPVEEKK